MVTWASQTVITIHLVGATSLARVIQVDNRNPRRSICFSIGKSCTFSVNDRRSFFVRKQVYPSFSLKLVLRQNRDDSRDLRIKKHLAGCNVASGGLALFSGDYRRFPDSVPCYSALGNLNVLNPLPHASTSTFPRPQPAVRLYPKMSGRISDRQLGGDPGYEHAEAERGSNLAPSGTAVGESRAVENLEEGVEEEEPSQSYKEKEALSVFTFLKWVSTPSEN